MGCATDFPTHACRNQAQASSFGETAHEQCLSRGFDIRGGLVENGVPSAAGVLHGEKSLAGFCKKSGELRGTTDACDRKHFDHGMDRPAVSSRPKPSHRTFLLHIPSVHPQPASLALQKGRVGAQLLHRLLNPIVPEPCEASPSEKWASRGEGVDPHFTTVWLSQPNSIGTTRRIHHMTAEFRNPTPTRGRR
jgi:hypothetical protein